MAEKIAVLGIHPDYSSVKIGVDVLKEAGFRNTDISAQHSFAIMVQLLAFRASAPESGKICSIPAAFSVLARPRLR